MIALSGMPDAALAVDPPHNAHDTRFHTVGCSRCHSTRGVTPAWYTAPTFSDNTRMNNLCKDCHKPAALSGSRYEDVKTHSSYQTSEKYGTWVVECRTCHDPHYQNQAGTYGTDGIISTGTVSALLVSAAVSTVTVASTLSGSYENYDFIPNTAYPSLGYRIKSNTPNTVEVWGKIDTSNGFAGVGATYAIQYGKMIKSQIVTPRSGTRTVKFFDSHGPNSFADNDGTADGICQVCHTRTTSFRNNGTLEGQGHPVSRAGGNCTTCHEHKTGFKADCRNCHGTPPLIADPGGPDGLADSDRGTGSATAGSHEKHAVTHGYGCEVCHSGGMPQSSIYDKKIQIGFNTSGGSNPGTTYDGRSLLANGYTYSAGNDRTSITQNGSMQCSNIYCHSVAQTAAGGPLTGAPGEYATAPQWGTSGGGSRFCGPCHKNGSHHNNGGPAAMDSGSHPKHLSYRFAAPANTGLRSYRCAICHRYEQQKYGSYGTCDSCHTTNAIYSGHVNGKVDLVFDSSFGAITYNDTMPSPGAPGNGFFSCSNSYCHSNGTSVSSAVIPANTSPVWGSGALSCDSCHGNPPSYENGAPKKNSHQAHTGEPCSRCHIQTTADGATIASTVTHVNGKYEVSPDTVSSVSFTYTYSSSGSSCADISCHSGGSAQWGGNLP